MIEDKFEDGLATESIERRAVLQVRAVFTWDRQLPGTRDPEVLKEAGRTANPVGC